MTIPNGQVQESEELLSLAASEPFGRGGKRDCFVHPSFPERCVKVARPGCSARELYHRAPRRKRWRKSIDDFDESISDYKTLASLKSTNSEEVWEHLPKLFGWQETDLGTGLVIELIRDADGKVSRSFLEYLWRNGYDLAAQNAVDRFGSFWVRHAIPSRSIGLHNVAAQISSNQEIRLVVIDGFGSTEFLPLSVLTKSWARRRAASKVEALRSDIAALLERKTQGLDPGPYGFLLKRS